jgi:hypothetical protein
MFMDNTQIQIATERIATRLANRNLSSKQFACRDLGSNAPLCRREARRGQLGKKQGKSPPFQRQKTLDRALSLSVNA